MAPFLTQPKKGKHTKVKLFFTSMGIPRNGGSRKLEYVIIKSKTLVVKEIEQMNTSTRRFKGQALLSTVVSPEEKLIYFVRSTYRNEQLQWEGPRNHQLEPKDEEVAFTLHTDRLVPKEFRTMISLFGEEFGLTKEQVRVMTASPKKTKTAGEKRGQNEH